MSTTQHRALVSHASPKQNLLDQYASIFEAPSKLPPFRDISHVIRLKPHDKPPAVSAYKADPTTLAFIKSEIESLLAKGFIRPSTSPYAAGVHVVSKNDKHRLVIDYRRLNDITIKHEYPIPQLQNLFALLSNATHFSKLDMKSGYHQIRMHPDSIQYTNMVTRYGAYEWLVMPFGLINCPSTFCQIMQQIMFDYLDVFVICYLDDFIVYSQSEQQHEKHLQMIFQRFRDNHMFLNKDKCSFNQKSIDFLGHVISHNSVRPQFDKVESIKNWKPLNTKEDVQQFLGFINFYRTFIPNCASNSQHLTNLLKKDVPFVWTSAHQQEFEYLKSILVSDTCLTMPDMSQPFELFTDASNTCVSAVLTQNKRPVEYFSRKLRANELNWVIYEKEALALIEAINRWKHYLQTKPFTVKIDNQALSFLKSQKHLSSRQIRWIEFLASFSFDIKHVKSEHNQSDALSRSDLSHTHLNNMLANMSSVELRDDILDDIKAIYQTDDFCKKVLENPSNYKNQCLSVRDELIMKNNTQVFVPDSRTIKHKLMKEAHSGHFHIQKTLELLSRNWYWPAMATDVKQHIEKCKRCQINKTSTTRPYGLLQPHSIPDQPWQVISMDFITHLPEFEHNGLTYDSILTVTCKLTKMVHLIPLNTTASASEVAKLFFQNVVRIHGLPLLIISDRDVKFTSNFWKSLFKSFNTQLMFSSSYHPQTDGQSERTNRTVEQLIRTTVGLNETEWLESLPLIEFTINNAVNSSTGFSPFYLNYNFHPFTPMSVTTHDLSIKNALASTMAMKFHRNISQAQELLAQASNYQASYANKKRREITFEVGDQVYLSTKNLRMKINAKVKPRFVGPFRITQKISDVVYKLELPNNYTIHDVFHVSLLKPATTDDASSDSDSDDNDSHSSNTEHAHVELEDSDQQLYEVEKILGHRTRRNKHEYLIKWFGYSDEENSWETIDRLGQAHDLIEQYENEQRDDEDDNTKDNDNT